MRFDYVNEVPKGSHFWRTRWTALLWQFAKSDEKIMKINYLENKYSSVTSLQTTAYRAIKRMRLSMRVSIVGDDIYIIKKSID